jgi:hypothetical protein
LHLAEAQIEPIAVTAQGRFLCLSFRRNVESSVIHRFGKALDSGSRRDDEQTL